MNILIVCSNERVVEQIESTLGRKYKDARFIEVDDISHARYHTNQGKCDIVVIDMMVQECLGGAPKPLLQPAITFLKKVKLQFPLVKVLALFDEQKVGKKGQDEIMALGYGVTSWKPYSSDWMRKLNEYL